jgi:hypothetical protein
MPTTYPPSAPTITGDIVTISRFLNSPTLVARRLRTVLEQRYIADALLSGRFNVVGGAVQYESGETIFTADDPKAVAPGAEYPLTLSPTGQASIAKTVKWGQDAIITDEAIIRQNYSPVQKAMVKLANQNVKYVDSIALSAIATAVTATAPAGAAWNAAATAQQILQDVTLAKAAIISLNQGYDPDTVVLSDTAAAYVFSKFIGGGFLPREGGNPLGTGVVPVVAGMQWLTTPNIPTTQTVLVLDSTMLGGMADEDLGGANYVSAGGVGVQAKTIRQEETDRWRMRCRRVTVPVILEPSAARKITGIGV